MKNLPNLGKVDIKYKRCKACGICYNFCPRDVYVKKLKGKPQVDVEGRCTACKLCEYLCPDFAIKIEKRGKMPVVLLLDETIAHLREKMVVKELPLINRDNKRVIGEGEPFHTTGLSHDEKGFPATNKSNVIGDLNKYLKTKVEKKNEVITKIDFKGDKDYDILFVSYGISFRSSLAAMNKLRKDGYKIGLINLLTLWPFPGEQLRYYAKKAKTVMFAELNFEMIASESRKYIEDSKIHCVNRVDGQLIEPDQIIESLRKKGDLPWKSY